MRSFDEVMPLFQALGTVLSKYARIERRPVDFGAGTPLYPAEVHMLSTLDMLGDAHVTGIAKACGVTKGAVSQMLKRLREKGLVAREADTSGNTVIRLTELGRAVSQAHFAFHREHDREFLDYLRGLPDRDFALCLDMCRRMKAWMEAYPD
ncbi:MAG: MarR family transcriptional regulator [Desulfovibrio sp.]|nr:MarR family transcriptional regulator [Desulfovibrio sp.]